MCGETDGQYLYVVIIAGRCMRNTIHININTHIAFKNSLQRMWEIDEFVFGP